MDRYQEALASSRVPVSPEAVRGEVAKIVEKAGDYASPEVYQFLFSSIDLTTLSTTDSQSSVARFTQRVNDFDNDYPQYKNVAAICVYSNFAEVVRTNLDVPGVDIAVVAGGFPSSQTFTSVKVADCALSVAGGATEVDVVMNLGYFFDENYEDLCDELIELKQTVKDAHLKVILETGALKSYENIKKASVLAMYSDADFIKTSTGKIYDGATLDAAWVCCAEEVDAFSTCSFSFFKTSENGVIVVFAASLPPCRWTSVYSFGDNGFTVSAKPLTSYIIHMPFPLVNNDFFPSV